MFDRHDAEVFGFVENMSTFVCPNCGDAHDVFDAGGGERIAEEFDRPLLAEIPLDPSIREACETGEPVVSNGDAEAAKAFESLAEGVMDAVGELRRRSHAEGEPSTVDESRPAAERADARTN